MDPIVFKDNHPPSWTVQKSDTPWHIARIFLENPWRWSNVWENGSPPAYLLPGDQIVVVQKEGQSFLRYKAGQNAADNSGLVKLGPTIITSLVADNPELFSNTILPFKDVAAFINHGIIFKDDKHLNDMPHIVASKKQRMFSFQGSNAYVNALHLPKDNKNFAIYRHSGIYKDPDTDMQLGFNAKYIGKAHIGRQYQGLLSLHIDSSVSEVLVGDLVIPETATTNQADFLLHPATQESKIVALLTLIDSSGPYSSVVIRGGHDKNITRGEIFSIYSPMMISHNKTTDYVLIGKLMVYKVFDNLSYALILNSSGSVNRGDLLKP